MRGAQRKRHREGTALPQGTPHGDGSPVEFHQFFDQREPDPRAFVRPSLGAFNAIEAFEHIAQFAGGDADAGIFHRQLHLLLHHALESR